MDFDTRRVALALARTRLMAAKFPYCLLADSEDGWRKEMEASGKFVVQTSQSAVSRISQSAPPAPAQRPAGLETGDTAGLETRATLTPDLKRGFVYKRVPRITLKAIAKNEEIDAIHAEFAPKLEKALAAFNGCRPRAHTRRLGGGTIEPRRVRGPGLQGMGSAQGIAA